jgi:hypothetical protein
MLSPAREAVKLVQSIVVGKAPTGLNPGLRYLSEFMLINKRANAMPFANP